MNDVVDLPSVRRALDEVYRRRTHLPRPDRLAETVLDAYHRADRPWRLTSVVAVLWPIGATAGAQRGHGITVGAIRDELAQALADPSLDARGRWVVAAMVQAADNLPDTADLERVPRFADGHQVLAHQQSLVQAVQVGLGYAWRAGHLDAAARAYGRFVEAVLDLVGQKRLATTLLVASLSADALMKEIGYAAYRVAEHDREHPTPPPTPSFLRQAVRPAGLRGFVALRRIDPGRHLPPGWQVRAGTGPGRRGPGR